MPSRLPAESWSDIYQKPQFVALTLRRRKIVLRLFALSSLFYFSIPFLTTLFPNILSIKIWGPLNIGLLYGVLQYPIGGLIAITFAIKMRKIDSFAKDI
jgi:uncharacterized membrane protein (DUF485 family)